MQAYQPSRARLHGGVAWHSSNRTASHRWEPSLFDKDVIHTIPPAGLEEETDGSARSVKSSATW
jgi:hypothetical protein